MTTNEIIFSVEGMTCDHCERTVAKALRSVPGVETVLEVSHANAEARVVVGPDATAERVEQAVEKAGYCRMVNGWVTYIVG